MNIRLSIRIKAIFLAVPRFLRGALRLTPKPLSERAVKERAGFPFSLRQEAWRNRKNGAPAAELPTPLRIRSLCKAKMDEAVAWFRRRALRVRRQIGDLDVRGVERRLNPVSEDVGRKIALSRAGFAAEAGQLELEAQQAEDDLAEFRAVEGLGRAPIEPTLRALPFAVIFALVILEAGVSAPLFGQVNEYGDIGGFFQGLAYVLLPPLLGLAAGFFGIRMLKRKKARFRAAGFVICVTGFGKMGVYGILVAHLRLVLGPKPAATFMDAWHSLANSWLAFADLNEACALLALSWAAFVVALYEGGWRLADPVWGYSALARRAAEARAEVDAAIAEYRSGTEATGAAGVAEVDERESRGLRDCARATNTAERLVHDFDAALEAINTTRHNCETVLKLCDAELTGLGFPAGASPKLLPAPLPVACEGLLLGEGAQDQNFDRPTQLVEGLLRLQDRFRDVAEATRRKVRDCVAQELCEMPALVQRIAKNVREFLDTPIMLRGRFQPLPEDRP